MPTVHELSSLFDELPELPPPAPRQRRGPGASTSASASNSLQKSSSTVTSAANPQQKSVAVDRSSSASGRILAWFRAWFRAKPAVRVWRPNPFQVLKNGKKIIVVAAVDSGMISFYRFGQGVFEEWPMM